MRVFSTRPTVEAQADDEGLFTGKRGILKVYAPLNVTLIN